MPKQLEVGDTFTYPRDWDWIVEVPKAVVAAWLTELEIFSDVGGWANSPINNPRTQWLNKLAIVIEVDRGTQALYNHDGRYWLIQQRRVV